MNPSRRLGLALLVLALALAAGAASLWPAGARYAVQPPALAAAGAPALETEPATYVVQKGDSLYRIAGRFGITIDQLIAANNLTSTIIQPGQVLIIPGATNPEAPGAQAAPAAPDSIYARIRGNSLFIQRITEALDWMQVNDPDAFARVDGYITVITQSAFAHLAFARPLPGGGCAVQALARRGMTVELTAAILYHEASHCYQFATVGVLSVKEAEIYAYTEQLDFMGRHGFSESTLNYYRRVLEYYQNQPDDGKPIRPPNF